MYETVTALAAVVVPVITGVIAWLLIPKKLDGGEWRIVDHADGPLGLARALGWLAGGTVVAGALGWLAHQYLRESPTYAGFGLVSVALVYGLVVWTQGLRLREALQAAPGEIRAPRWPLSAGEVVEVTYRRRLRHGAPAGKAIGTLRRHEVTSRRNPDGKHVQVRQVVETRPLEDAEATFSDMVFVATWRFEVPEALDWSSVPPFVRRLLAAGMSGLLPATWWTLDVDLPLENGVTVDSRFRLDIAPSAERGQLPRGA